MHRVAEQYCHDTTRLCDSCNRIHLQEVEDTLVTFLERGATVETDILANIKVLLPPDVTKQLDELIPPPPNSQPTEVVVEPEEMPTVIYTADAVLENQIGEQKHALV
eukprot:GHUV01022415.1.p2 GENE.GHUV01022415.1~~GHUV01022415.1.p2  ORF type:complete len:107 (+),score=30.87 GHUV01022415.1:119-439(+)